MTDKTELPGFADICDALINLIEGHPQMRWTDEAGARLKDQPEWVAFYVATKRLAPRAQAAVADGFVLTDEERQALQWASQQDFQSVAARYAKTLAGALNRAVLAAAPAPAESKAAEPVVDEAELLRLRAIEHYCWHLVDAAEDDGKLLTIDMTISKREIDALNKLLPESHPPITAEQSEAALRGGA